MHFFVETKRQQKSIELDVLTKGNKIIIIGHDAYKPNTEYFNRLMLQDGTFVFNLPQSPEVLKIVVLDINEGDTDVSNNYQLTGFRFNNLNTNPLIIDNYTKEFIELAQIFAEKSGYINPGSYYSRNKNFLIKYMSQIADDRKTPSRIHKYTGVIDVSKEWFDNMTVPGRMAILLHEFAHNNLNKLQESSNDTEKEADKNAFEIYSALGYPRIEWSNAWTYVFEDYSAHFDRIDNNNAMLQKRN